MRNPVRECESPAGQCCVISSLVSESHSSGCPWDKFTLGGESGRDGTAPLGVTGIQRGQEDSWLSPLCPGQHSFNPLLSSLVPGIVFTLQSGPKKSKFGVMRGQPAGDACGCSPFLSGSPCNCRETFWVCIFLLGVWHGFLKSRISIPGVSGLTAGGGLSCSCSFTQL